jgi:hypothetical protein
MPITSFNSTNSVLLIHHQFEGGGVRCILAFLLLHSFRRFFIYFFHVHIYIYSALMNISAIYNKAHKCSLGRNIRSI